MLRLNKWRWVADRLPWKLVKACFDVWNEKLLNDALEELYKKGGTPMGSVNVKVGPWGHFSPTTEKPGLSDKKEGEKFSSVEYYVSDFGTHLIVQKEDDDK